MVSLLTFNFNEYDTIRTHYLSPYINYVYVSETDTNITGFTNKVFNQNNDPWYNSLYVRYHPFEFVNTDVAIVVDASISSNDNINELCDTFLQSNCDIGVVLAYEPNLMVRIDNWKYRQRINDKEASILKEMVRTYASERYLGVVAGAVHLYKNTETAKQYLETCWKLITSTPNPIRLDEIPSTVALEIVKDMKIMPFSMNLIQGDVFNCYHHKSDINRVFLFNKKKFWLRNQQVTPIMIGKQYHRTFKHDTECMCLTRYFSESEMKSWIDHHLSLGFSHIHIFDNGCKFNCKELCNSYGGYVSYEFVKGNARHYKIFNDYVNSNRCKSEWIIPIDDDEYLTINPNVGTTVIDLINWFKNKFPNEHMYAIRWKHLFPKKFHSEPSGTILEYCTEENPTLASSFQRMGDRGIKTLVHRYGVIYYEETEENPCGGHVPKHNMSNGARLFNGEVITTCSCSHVPTDANEPARLLHCRFKGYSSYKQKNQDIKNNNLCLDNTSGLIYTRNYKFDDILETLE